MILRTHKKKNRQTDRSRLLTSFPLNSRYAEAYRTLRTNLFFSGTDNEIKSIVVTSALEKEGKTTTAFNLAYTVAQTDRQVLLMDCDLRRPYLSTLAAGSTGDPTPGVTDLVTETFGIHLTTGDLETYSLADLTQLVRLQKRSARLALENDKIQAVMVFEKGVLTDIEWKNRPESRNLINTLIRKNLLTENQAKLAVTHQKKSVYHLGRILTSTGLVPKKDLAQALSIYTIEAIREVSAMDTGRFEFLPPTGNPNDAAGILSVNIEKLFQEYALEDHSLTYINAAIESSILPTEVDNLFVLPSGKTPPNPSEVVGSNRMAFLIAQLKARFDFIIIDTPPVTPATDALLIAPLTDGAVLVVKSGNTDRKIIQDAVDQFKTVKQPVIGMVLNQVDMRKEGYYRYYQKYYTSYYGSK